MDLLVQKFVRRANHPKVPIASKQIERVKEISDAKSPKRRSAVGSRALVKGTVRLPLVVRDDQLDVAVRTLRNAETKSKIYPPELVTALRGMFSSTRVYKFQLHQTLTVASSAGGSTLGFVALSPSVASYGEWSALAALFDEVKGVSTSIDWLSSQATALLSGVNPMLMAVDEQNLSTDPASFLSVARLAGSRSFVSQLGGGGSGRTVMKHRLASRSWCATVTPYSVSPIGGLIGCWVYANGTTWTPSIGIAIVSSVTVAAFRCRA